MTRALLHRIFWIALMACVTAVVYYLSRFWSFRLWDREGLFGLPDLRPQGGLVGQWVRGTDLAPYELLIWVLGIFALLTALQKIFGWLTRAGDEDGDATD